MTNFASHPWRAGEAHPDRLALRCGEDTWTYGRLREAVAGFAGSLRARGIGPGARAVLIAPTVPEFAVAYYGLQAAGVVAIAMNPMATRYEVDYVLGDADCSLVVTWHECAQEGQEAARGRGVETWTLVPEATGLPEGEAVQRPHDARDDETAVLLYTSGTTGDPKGAELTHGNLAACGEAFREVLEVTEDDAFGTSLPLFHAFGGSVVMGTALMSGAALAMLPRFRPAAALQLVSSGAITIFAGVPTMYNALLQEVDDDFDFSRLRFCCSGGASLPVEILREFEERFGIVILEGYALTETTGAATFNGLHRRRKPGFVGIPLPRTEVRVVDDGGRELDVGEVGEVQIRGPQVMKGYHGRPEATAEAVQDGWLRSGDLGAKDEDGDLRIVDRRKDMIIRGGYNVYPQEVEHVLYEHPMVVEAAVIGVADERLGEEVAAIVALRAAGELDAEELSAWLRVRVAAYKAPRLFKFVDALPKGATGKILKRGISADGLVAVRSSAR